MARIFISVGQKWFNVEKSGTCTKVCTDPDYTGTSVLYVVPAGTYSSLISQADADAQAQADVTANCQTYANTHGECIQTTFWNVQKQQTFTRNNCNAGYVGGQYTYIVPAHTYSASSQVAADQLALDDIALNGQNQANLPENATCTQVTFPFKWIPDPGASFCESICDLGITFVVTNETSTTAIVEAFPSGGIAPYTYAWSNGQTTKIATGLLKDVEYTVIVTDATGCSDTEAVTPNIEILSGLKIEIMYFSFATVVTTDPFYPRICGVGSHNCNRARYEVFANTVSQGIANLNNANGTSIPDGTIDDHNLPPTGYDAPSGTDRYWEKTFTGEDAAAIAGPGGTVEFTLTWTGIDPAGAHGDASWLRITKEDGSPLLNTCINSFTSYIFDPYA